jgi:chaperone required for assembly of F1-ATPase
MSTDEFLSTFAGRPDGAVDPMVSARSAMRGPFPKRFYKQASVIATEGGFQIALDGKGVKTPVKRALAVPDQSLAEAIAAEWQAQGSHIDPSSMPLTCLINAALDGVADQAGAVREEIIRYAGNDALCYRTSEPPRLTERQNLVWNPILAWAEAELGLKLNLAEGVIHVAQPDESIAAAAKAVAAVPAPLGLAALNTITTLTGSAIVALALWHGYLDADAVWVAAHVDEDFQIEVWGQDHEAAVRRANRRIQFDAAVLVLQGAVASA